MNYTDCLQKHYFEIIDDEIDKTKLCHSVQEHICNDFFMRRKHYLKVSKDSVMWVQELKKQLESVIHQDFHLLKTIQSFLTKEDQCLKIEENNFKKIQPIINDVMPIMERKFRYSSYSI